MTINWQARSLHKALILNYPGYTPVRLLNAVAWHLKAGSDCALADALNFDRGQLNRVRHKKAVISDTLLISILDATGWTLKHARELAGMPSDAEFRREIRYAMGVEKRKPVHAAA